MPNEGSIGDEVAFVEQLRSLVSAYEEIAVMRIGRVRKSVLTARQFEDGLAEVFHKVRSSYQQEMREALHKGHGHEELGQQQVAVLLSTNTRLSGQVSKSVTDSFIQFLEQQQDGIDVVIIGEVGKQRFTEARPDRPYKFFDLPDGNVSTQTLLPLIRHLLRYEIITIFFARFKNILSQEPMKVVLGEQNLLEEHKQPAKAGGGVGRMLYKGPIYPFMFEPSLDTVVNFFHDEILGVLIRQTWGEAWLSLLGSRITAMEKASQNITERLKSLEWEERREMRRIKNKKQRDRLAGISLWYER